MSERTLSYSAQLNTSVTSAAGATVFWRFGTQRVLNSSPTEANVQYTVRFPGTFSNLLCRLEANASTGTSTFLFRKNTANGNQTMSIGSGATGLFQDNSNKDSVVNGDLVCWSSVGASGGTMTWDLQGVGFNGTSNNYLVYGGSLTSTVTNASATETLGYAGDSTASVTDANSAITVLTSSTMQGAWMIVNANARASACTFGSRKNNATGAQSASIGANATGYFDDQVNTDSIVATNTFDLQLVTGTGTSSITFWAAGVVRTSNDSVSDLLNVSGPLSFIAGQTNYHAISGTFANGGSSSETSATQPTNRDGQLKNLSVNITVNSVAASTLRTRIAAGNGNVSASITANTTGIYTDNSNIDQITSTQNVNMQSVTGAGTTLSARFILLSFAPTDIDATDSTAVTESVSMELVDAINVTDTSAVTDTATIRDFQVLTLTETTTVTATPTILIPILTINVSDSTAVTDNPSEYEPKQQPMITFRNVTSPYAVLAAASYVQSSIGGGNIPVLQGENSNIVSFRIYNNFGLTPNVADAVNVRIGAYDSVIIHTAIQSVITQSWLRIYETGFGENSVTPGQYTQYNDLQAGNGTAIGGLPAGTDVYFPAFGSDGSGTSQIRAGTNHNGVGFIEFASFIEMPDTVGMFGYTFVITVQYEWVS